MFLDRLKLTIDTDGKIEVLRDLKFNKGMNLILDQTSENQRLLSGNGVGKTTVLKLVDYAFGAERSIIYKTDKREKDEDTKVKEFVSEKNLAVELILASNLDDPHSTKIILKRNFASYKKEKLFSINGTAYDEKGYKKKLEELLFPGKGEKPSLRQLISHNIRYRSPAVDSTLYTVHASTKDEEYQKLYFYMFGIKEPDSFSQLRRLTEERDSENKYLLRLLEDNSLADYMVLLESVKNEIAKCEEFKSLMGVNENTIADIDALDDVKRKITRKSGYINKLNIKKALIEESKIEIEKDKANIDVDSLRVLYEESSKALGQLVVSFESLVDYHNKMLDEKLKFIISELPEILSEIERAKAELEELTAEEFKISSRISRSEYYDAIEANINRLNHLYESKGAYELSIASIRSSEEKISILNNKIAKLSHETENADLEKVIFNRVSSFNEIYSAVSEKLYGEKYMLSFDSPSSSRNKVYKFKSITDKAFSTGKKQGEIISFDIAYTIFADKFKIPCMHFLLDDRKELMHGNPLMQIAEYVKDKDIQVVFSILADKVPAPMLSVSNIVVRLSQEDKLFKIESTN